jgi:hypothetical protein
MGLLFRVEPTIGGLAGTATSDPRKKSRGEGNAPQLPVAPVSLTAQEPDHAQGRTAVTTMAATGL